MPCRLRGHFSLSTCQASRVVDGNSLLDNHLSSPIGGRYPALPTTSSFTGAVPFLPRPIFAAAALDRSTTRPACVGPRSLIRTSTVLLLLVFVTLTFVPNGNVG